MNAPNPITDTATPLTGHSGAATGKIDGRRRVKTDEQKANAKAGFKRWQASGQQPARRHGSRVVQRKIGNSWKWVVRG